MNKDTFINKFCNDLRNSFDTVKFKDETIYITHKGFDIHLPNDLYLEYMRDGNYNKLLNTYIDLIENQIMQQCHKIDIDRILPVVRKQGFAGKNDDMFIKKELGADLYTYFVEDMGEVWRYITHQDAMNNDLSLSEIEEYAQNNINKFSNILVPLDEELKIYMLKFENSIGSNIFFNTQIQQQIKKISNKKDALIAFPNETTFLVCSNNSVYQDVLSEIVEFDPGIEKTISKRIYKIEDGKLSFADNKETKLRLVK
ncbi:DUF1444 family protein [Anaerophilus nitritogenes]|uniref:DUF1444 family protein n=1 Tax=Anaerophilus nitritogenes TaxID=2498136 RepID=UPI0013ED4B96|nr:DUF1444 family protein [Anaerophilus nitritogenes]